MCTYLPPIKAGQNYKFRRRVPTELRAIIGQREWSITLETKDREEAKRRVPFHTIETNRLIAEARAKLAAMETAAKRPTLSPQPMTPEQTAWERAEREHLAAQDADTAEREADEAAMAERMKPHLAALDALLSGSGEGLNSRERAIRTRLLGAEYDLKTARYAERAARWQLQQAEKVAAKVPAEQADTLTGDPVKLEPLLEAYAAENGERSKRGLASSYTHVRNLRDFLPADDARLATPDRVIAWKDYLLRAKADGGRGVSNKTVQDGYLATVRALFKWAAQNRKITSNPVDGVSVRVPRKIKVGERSFTDAEAKAVLQATFKQRPTLSPQYQLACRWVPWLLAYSGARVGEVAQLRAEDVMQVEGVWVMNITPEAGSVKTKTYRHVPLHSHLVEMGFVDVAKANKAGPLFYDPEAATRQTANASKSLSEKVGEKVR